VNRDLDEAVKWYQLAAEQGDAASQAQLGLFYESGRSVAQDYATAVRWYELAAKQGDMHGQHNLGLCYEQAKGVDQDYAQALDWYTQAAEQGHAEAKNNLGGFTFMALVSRLIKKKPASYGKKRQQRAMRQLKLTCGFCGRRDDGMSKNGQIEKIALAIPAGWKVAWNTFCHVSLEEALQREGKAGALNSYFTEDLLLLQRLNKELSLDVGWNPDTGFIWSV